jgi:hypothetical protein
MVSKFSGKVKIITVVVITIRAEPRGIKPFVVFVRSKINVE